MSLRRVLSASPPGERRQPEVEHLDLALRVDQHVARLEITMHDASTMRRPDSLGQLTKDAERFPYGDSPTASERTRQGLALDVLHRDESAAVGLPDVVQTNDVGMADTPRDADLVTETIPADGRALGRGVEELERDDLSDLVIQGAIDPAEASLAQRSEDLVPVADPDPRPEIGGIETSIAHRIDCREAERPDAAPAGRWPAASSLDANRPDRFTSHRERLAWRFGSLLFPPSLTRFMRAVYEGTLRGVRRRHAPCRASDPRGLPCRESDRPIRCCSGRC
jgi:hypothetical protein